MWGGRSGHTYTLTRQPNGTTDIDVEIVREGKNFKGRLLGVFLGIVGKGQLEKWFAKTLKAIEARNGAARATGASSDRVIQMFVDQEDFIELLDITFCKGEKS